MKADQVLKLFLAGEELRCPHTGCNNILESIPKQSSYGAHPVVIRCPINEQHFLIYYEPADAMNEVRDFIIELGNLKNNK